MDLTDLHRLLLARGRSGDLWIEGLSTGGRLGGYELHRGPGGSWTLCYYERGTLDVVLAGLTETGAVSAAVDVLEGRPLG